MKTVYLLLIALLVTTCDSDDPVDPASLLPPITMTGENTFGCLIDGKFFRPRDGRSTINSDNKGLFIYQTEQDNFEIIVNDFKSGRTGNLTIHLEDLFIINEGIYQVNSSNGLRGIDGNNNNYIYGRFWKNNEVGYQRYISYKNSGEIEILKRDFVPNNSHIYSGTFKTNLINVADLNDTIKVALGRFDIDAFTFLNQNYD